MRARLKRWKRSKEEISHGHITELFPHQLWTAKASVPEPPLNRLSICSDAKPEASSPEKEREKAALKHGHAQQIHIPKLMPSITGGTELLRRKIHFRFISLYSKATRDFMLQSKDVQ